MNFAVSAKPFLLPRPLPVSLPLGKNPRIRTRPIALAGGAILVGNIDLFFDVLISYFHHDPLCDTGNKQSDNSFLYLLRLGTAERCAKHARSGIR